MRLFGAEVSTNVANAFNASLKGRFHETRINDDHRLENASYPVLKLVDGAVKRVDEPALTALNMRLRDDYTADCAKSVERWNKIIDKSGIAFKAAAAPCGVPSSDRRISRYSRHALR